MARQRPDNHILRGIKQQSRGYVSGDVDRLIRVLQLSCTQKAFREAIDRLVADGKIRREGFKQQPSHMKLTLRSKKPRR